MDPKIRENIALCLAILATVFVVTTFAFAAKPTPIPQLVIQSVVVESNTLQINGENLTNGNTLAVTLSGNTLTVITSSSTQIVASFPPTTLAGTYKLIVVTGSASNQKGEFYVTIGAAGPPGPSHSYAGVTVVARSGGNYDNPLTAMESLSEWCGTPSNTNTCLLKIMPGEYDIGSNSLQMREFVDIEGSGENTTVIKGNNDSSTTSGVVVGASNAEIRLLTIKNIGGGYYSIAFLNNSASPKITNVTAIAFNSASTEENTAISNWNNSSPILQNVTAIATGTGKTNLSIRNDQSSPILINVTSYALDAIDNAGVLNGYSSPTMRNVAITAAGTGHENYGIDNVLSNNVEVTNTTINVSGNAENNAGIINNNSSSSIEGVRIVSIGGGNNYGISNFASSSLMVFNVTSSVSGGTNNYGIYNLGTNCTVRIDNSAISSSAITVNNSGGTVYIANTKLDGAPVVNTGTLKCAGVYDGNYVFSPNTCP